MKIANIFGGPSEERNLTINSARSVLDYLQTYDIEISMRLS